MKFLKSGLIIGVGALASSFLKSKGYAKTGALVLVTASLGALAALYIQTWAAELTTIPTNFAAADAGYLDVGISAAATTITVSPIDKWVNGTKTEGCFDSTNGFVLIQDGAGRSEYASYGTKACSASNVTTLTDVRRGLDPTTCTFTAGTGLSFSAGSSIRVVNHPCIFNHAVYDLNDNVLTGSGRIRSTQTTQTWLTPTNVTTAQRDAFTDVRAGDIIHNTTLGIPQFYDGSSWQSYGTGALVNAAAAVRGVIELSTAAEALSGSTVGSTGAPLVPPNSLLTMSGGTAGMIVLTNTQGYLSVRAGGTGTGSLTQSGVLIGNSGSYITSVLPGAADNVLVSDGQNWTAGTVPTKFDLIGAVTGSSAIVGASSTSENAMSPTWTTTNSIGANTLAVGDVVKIRISGLYRLDASNLNFRVKLGGTTVFVNSEAATVDSTTKHYEINVSLVVRSIGASGKVVAGGTISAAGDGAGSNALSNPQLTLDTTGALAVTVTSQFGGSDAQHFTEIEAGEIYHLKQ